MRGRFEFTFHTISEESAQTGDVDPTLALLGSQGWEIRALTCLRSGTITVALQRPFDEEVPLADASSLSAALAEPLAAPQLNVP